MQLIRAVTYHMHMTTVLGRFIQHTRSEGTMVVTMGTN